MSGCADDSSEEKASHYSLMMTKAIEAYKNKEFKKAVSYIYQAPYPYDNLRKWYAMEIKPDKSWVTPQKFGCKPSPAPCDALDFFMVEREFGDFQPAKERLIKRCENNIALACTFLGIINDKDRESGTDLSYLKKAYELGEPTGSAYYAMKLRQLPGKGKIGASILAKICETGHPFACEDYACHLKDNQEIDQAKVLLEQSCVDGHIQGCHWFMELLALDGKKFKSKIVNILDLSCESGHMNSCFMKAEVAKAKYKYKITRLSYFGESHSLKQDLERLEAKNVGLKQDLCKMYEKLCKMNIRDSCLTLASFKKTKEQYAETLAKVCLSGDVMACQEYGQTIPVVNPNTEKIVKYVKSRCDKQDENWCTVYTYSFQNAVDGKPMRDKLMQDECKNGNAGFCYTLGHTAMMEARYEDATNYYKVGCSLGHQEACKMLEKEGKFKPVRIKFGEKVLDILDTCGSKCETMRTTFKTLHEYRLKHKQTVVSLEKNLNYKDNEKKLEELIRKKKENISVKEKLNPELLQYLAKFGEAGTECLLMAINDSYDVNRKNAYDALSEIDQPIKNSLTYFEKALEYERKDEIFEIGIDIADRLMASNSEKADLYIHLAKKTAARKTLPLVLGKLNALTLDNETQQKIVKLMIRKRYRNLSDKLFAMIAPDRFAPENVVTEIVNYLEDFSKDQSINMNALHMLCKYGNKAGPAIPFVSKKLRNILLSVELQKSSNERPNEKLHLVQELLTTLYYINQADERVVELAKMIKQNPYFNQTDKTSVVADKILVAAGVQAPEPMCRGEKGIRDIILHYEHSKRYSLQAVCHKNSGCSRVEFEITIHPIKERKAGDIKKNLSALESNSMPDTFRVSFKTLFTQNSSNINIRVVAKAFGYDGEFIDSKNKFYNSCSEDPDFKVKGLLIKLGKRHEPDSIEIKLDIDHPCDILRIDARIRGVEKNELNSVVGVLDSAKTYRFISGKFQGSATGKNNKAIVKAHTAKLHDNCYRKISPGGIIFADIEIEDCWGRSSSISWHGDMSEARVLTKMSFD